MDQMIFLVSTPVPKVPWNAGSGLQNVSVSSGAAQSLEREGIVSLKFSPNDGLGFRVILGSMNLPSYWETQPGTPRLHSKRIISKDNHRISY